MRIIAIIPASCVVGMLITVLSPQVTRSQPTSSETSDMIQRADVIVVGRVTNVRSAWNSDRSRIYTQVTVSVDQHIKGDETQQSVTIATLGGEVDGIGEVYSHTARFKTDEQVVVFAAADRQGQLRVVGGDEGKLTVMNDAVTGLQMVSDREPLSVFTNRIRTIVQAQRH